MKQQADGVRSQREFTDDTSTTVLVGTSDGPISWTKPQDLEFSDMLPALGMKGSFAAPYASSQGKYALFLFGDLHISAVSDSLPAATLHKLVRIDDGLATPELSRHLDLDGAQGRGSKE